MRALTLNMTSIFTGLMSVELIGSIACWMDPAATTNLPRVNRPLQIAKGLSEGEVTEKKRTLEEGDWRSGEKLRKGSKHFSPVSPLLQCFLSLSSLPLLPPFPVPFKRLLRRPRLNQAKHGHFLPEMVRLSVCTYRSIRLLYKLLLVEIFSPGRGTPLK